MSRTRIPLELAERREALLDRGDVETVRLAKDKNGHAILAAHIKAPLVDCPSCDGSGSWHQWEQTGQRDKYGKPLKRLERYDCPDCWNGLARSTDPADQAIELWDADGLIEGVLCGSAVIEFIQMQLGGCPQQAPMERKERRWPAGWRVAETQPGE